MLGSSLVFLEYFYDQAYISLCFPDGSVGKEYACNVGDVGSIPGSGGALLVQEMHQEIQVLQFSCVIAQMVKSLPVVWETWGWEDPLVKGMATYSSIQGQRSLVGYSP